MVRISDKEIIDTLAENARIKYTEISKKFGVSEAAIRKRIKKLEKKGIIRKYTIEVDHRKLNESVALIGIDIEPEKYIEVIEKLKSDQKIKSILRTTGDHDILIKIIYEESTELNEFVKFLENMSGVGRICPAIIVEEIK